MKKRTDNARQWARNFEKTITNADAELNGKIEKAKKKMWESVLRGISSTDPIQ